MPVHRSRVSPEWAAEVVIAHAAGSVLHLGGESDHLAAELVARGLAVTRVAFEAPPDGSAPDHEWATVHSDPVSLQLEQRFDLVWLSLPSSPHDSSFDTRSVVHAAVQHVVPGGHVVMELPLSEAAPADAVALGGLCAEFDLTELSAVGDGQLTCYRRTERFTVHDLVFEARGSIGRVSPQELQRRLLGDHPPLVLDTRTHTDRLRFGVIDGAVHAPRTVLEWHLDPANGYRHPAICSFDQPLVVVCNGGYSSSLAAANLVRVGFTDVSDLIGGVHAWGSAGLPMSTPDHSHLDL